MSRQRMQAGSNRWIRERQKHHKPGKEKGNRTIRTVPGTNESGDINTDRGSISGSAPILLLFKAALFTSASSSPPVSLVPPWRKRELPALSPYLMLSPVPPKKWRRIEAPPEGEPGLPTETGMRDAARVVVLLLPPAAGGEEVLTSLSTDPWLFILRERPRRR